MNSAARSAPLIGARELADRLESQSLLVVDCRFDLTRPEWGEAAYHEGHVPGAVFAGLETALSAPATATTGRHPLPSPEAFAATLGSWGLMPQTEVVAYDQGAGVAAARLWWMLRARGHGGVRVLDGGLAGWVMAGLPVDGAIPERPRTRVAAVPFAGVVDAAAVQRGLADRTIRVVDARGADRFAGQNETIDPVAGHVPGARNHPYTLNLGTDGRLLGEDALRTAWRNSLAGIAPAQLVMMCGSGVSACHNLLALALQGVHGARLYAGSFSEWIRDTSRPVATGPATGGEP
jgi:thiosulfate/3-mercaptopyruvate sulfurtransferase